LSLVTEDLRRRERARWLNATVPHRDRITERYRKRQPPVVVDAVAAGVRQSGEQSACYRALGGGQMPWED